MRKNHNNFIRLAFNKAKINLGKTSPNPSVGCIIVKNQSVISSGFTSIGGRPHAENNALNQNKNFKNSTMYVTLEPCVHYGKTPPCSNLIINKKIKKVFYTFNDVDPRTSNKLKKKLKKKNIHVKKIPYKEFKDFYTSYFNSFINEVPYVDAKLAISKDFYTIDKKKEWITNRFSRKRVHLLRSEYEAIISTSSSINADNSILNCRLKGFDNLKPDLIIIDLKLKIKKDLKIFKRKTKRKIIIVTSIKKHQKINYLKSKGVKLIKIDNLKSKKDFLSFFKILKKINYNRILIESGLVFLKSSIESNIISNLYTFVSHRKLGKRGLNNTSINFLKKKKLNKKIKVNLGGDLLYKIKLKNV